MLDSFIEEITSSTFQLQTDRTAVLQDIYGISGTVVCGGHIDLVSNLCNITRQNMLQDRDPEVGDIIALGSLCNLLKTSVVIGRLKKDYTDQWPVCPITGNYFRWEFEPITTYRFCALST